MKKALRASANNRVPNAFKTFDAVRLVFFDTANVQPLRAF